MPSPTSFCSSCPFCLFSPHKPSPLGPLGPRHSVKLKPTWKASPHPHPQHREGAMASFLNNVACLCAPRPTLLSSCQPVASLKAASSLGLLPSVWAMMWALSYRMPRLAAAQLCSRKSCHQAQPSSSYYVIHREALTEPAHVSHLSPHYTPFWPGSFFFFTFF